MSWQDIIWIVYAYHVPFNSLINIPLQKDHPEIYFSTISELFRQQSSIVLIGDTANEAHIKLSHYCLNCSFLFVSFICTFITIHSSSGSFESHLRQFSSPILTYSSILINNNTLYIHYYQFHLWVTAFVLPGVTIYSYHSNLETWVVIH